MNDFKLGDTVRVTDSDNCYSCYETWPSPALVGAFRYGRTAQRGMVGTVMQVGKHINTDIPLVGIHVEECGSVHLYIMDGEAVELVHRHNVYIGADGEPLPDSVEFSLGETVLIEDSGKVYAYYGDWLDDHLKADLVQGEYPTEGDCAMVVQIARHPVDGVPLLGVAIDGKVFVIEEAGVANLEDGFVDVPISELKIQIGDTVRIRNGTENFWAYRDWLNAELQPKFITDACLADGARATVVQIAPHGGDVYQYGTLYGVLLNDQVYIYEEVDIELVQQAVNPVTTTVTKYPIIPEDLRGIITMALTNLGEKLRADESAANTAKMPNIANVYMEMQIDVARALRLVHW